MANLITTDTELTSVANAIRAKTGGTAQLEYPTEFISKIGTLVDLETATGDADAAAGDVAENKTAYVNGVKITGTMAEATGVSF